jgi:hypothetical protein
MAEDDRVEKSNVAAEDTFAYDEDGFRRYVRAGDSIPDYWTWESERDAMTKGRARRTAKRQDRRDED